MVNEPSVEDTISILRGLKERYEVFHGVKIQDQALIAAATLSNRYITDRFLPDKAIDLVDEACAMIRSEMDSMPAEMDELNRKIMRHEIEGGGAEEGNRHAVSGTSSGHPERAGRYARPVQRNEGQVGETKKNAIGKVQKLREEIESSTRNWTRQSANTTSTAPPENRIRQAAAAQKAGAGGAHCRGRQAPCCATA